MPIKEYQMPLTGREEDRKSRARYVAVKPGTRWLPALGCVRETLVPDGGSMPASRQRKLRAIARSAAAAASVLALMAPAVSHAAPAGIQFRRAVTLPFPGARFAAVSSASCGAAGSCTLGGEFVGRSGLSHIVVITRANGRWGDPIKLQLPQGSPPGFAGAVNSISCTRVGSCVAVGS